MKEKIAIIGAGKMGKAIAQGLLNKKVITHNQLVLTNSQTKNNKEAVMHAEIIVLATKPQMARVVMEEIKSEIKDQLVISIMAGITIDAIQQAFGKVAIVRVMPNLGAKVGQSMSVWIKSKEVTKSHEASAKVILEAIGTQLELHEEQQIDMATAISGSGPAYFFYIVEQLEECAKLLGLSNKEGRILASQTLTGAAELLKHSGKPVKVLRGSVTSKGGTTEAAFVKFEKGKLGKLFKEGVVAAYKRAMELKIS